jgi:xanthine/uracil permease
MTAGAIVMVMAVCPKLMDLIAIIPGPIKRGTSSYMTYDYHEWAMIHSTR